MNYIIIFLISMIPLAELRVAIPTGIAMGVSVLPAYAICILGNLLPMPFVYLFSHRLLEWGKNKKVIGKFFRFCIEKARVPDENCKIPQEGDCLLRLYSL